LVGRGDSLVPGTLTESEGSSEAQNRLDFERVAVRKIGKDGGRRKKSKKDTPQLNYPYC